MQKKNTGMKFVDPTGTIEIEKIFDFFVDDTAIGVSENCINDGATVLEHLRRDEQRHSFLLFAAGHLLALFKCIFIIIHSNSSALNLFIQRIMNYQVNFTFNQNMAVQMKK